MIDTKKIYTYMLNRAAFFLVLVCLVHILAMNLDLYYIIPWFDIMMHTLGGVSFGFFIFAALTRMFPSMYQTPKFWILWILGGVAVVVGWEIFEYILYLVNIREWNDMLDSINDIFCGLLGALVAVLTSNKIFINVNKTQ